MSALLYWIAVSAALLAVAGCGPRATNPPEGCRGHGGVVDPGAIDRGDATNSEKVVACKDGTLVHLHY